MAHRAPPALLLLTGELALAQGDTGRALSAYTVGLAGPDRSRFEAVTAELRQAWRANGRFDLAATTRTKQNQNTSDNAAL